MPYALAIDQSGNVWVANSSTNSITKLSSTGASGTNYTGNSLNVPKGIAIDAQGDVFVSNSGSNSFSGFTSTGAALSGSPFSSSSFSAPVGIAISPY